MLWKFQVSFCALHGFFAILTFCISLKVVPAIYKYTKDQILIAFESREKLWNNFYQIELCKSVLKLDFVMNVQFWTELVFLNFCLGAKDAETFFYWSGNITIGGIALMAIISDYIGFRCITKVNAFKTKSSFFVLRFLVEALKYYIAICLFKGRNMFW